ncbi:MAG: HAD family hydrolase [Reyranella sp.]|uniref:HAD family hydrolase n=1 Tax=Reyranella sp. TaxID=1929291 RepID=UPI00273030DF|nr:HAD family hydrolase [Reyranella sp.]MDP1961266.1 HAD family hydrolase [Reyranella sp.]MDP2374286.1 HAD family hydrolase [Reyranella sp.]
MAYRAALFDIGGPLDLEFARESAADSAIAMACGLEGIRVDEAMIEAASEAAVEAFAANAYAHMIDTLCGGDPQTIGRVEARVRAMLGNLDVFQLRPEIDALLRRLRGRGVPLGIVANQSAAAREQLVRAGIGELFAYQGLSALTGFSKPDPRAFATAAEALGVAAPACIMVGDRIDNDIVPAKALGMAAIRFKTGRHRRQKPRSAAEAPDANVTDVRELEEAILALLG